MFLAAMSYWTFLFPVLFEMNVTDMYISSEDVSMFQFKNEFRAKYLELNDIYKLD